METRTGVLHAPHLLVLPTFGWATGTFDPYLLPLRAHTTITRVRLPTVAEITGKSRFRGDHGRFPIDTLFKALEAFREDRKIARFMILAEGAAGWIALKYAKRFPEHCAALILIDTTLDRHAHLDTLAYAAARGSPSERWIGKTLSARTQLPRPRGSRNRLAVRDRVSAPGVRRNHRHEVARGPHPRRSRAVPVQRTERVSRLPPRGAHPQTLPKRHRRPRPRVNGPSVDHGVRSLPLDHPPFPDALQTPALIQSANSTRQNGPSIRRTS